MKIQYFKEDNILVIELSKARYDHAEMEGDFVIHYTPKGTPVRIEILDAARYFKTQAEALPKDTKQSFFASA
ncbi:MAG: DUF2283 domain-containing protein [Patescibacteria group bacterium]